MLVSFRGERVKSPVKLIFIRLSFCEVSRGVIRDQLVGKGG